MGSIWDSKNDEYGTSFEWRQAEGSSKKGFTAWSPFPQDTKYFDPSTRDFMVNDGVENIKLLVSELQKEGVTIFDATESFDNGKFVHIQDIEGNKIELWEPDDTEYEKIIAGRPK